MTNHDLIMSVMRDGVERSTPEIVDAIFPNTNRTQRNAHLNRINEALRVAVRYRFLERVGTQKRNGAYAVVYKAVAE